MTIFLLINNYSSRVSYLSCYWPITLYISSYFPSIYLQAENMDNKKSLLLKNRFIELLDFQHALLQSKWNGKNPILLTCHSIAVIPKFFLPFLYYLHLVPASAASLSNVSLLLYHTILLELVKRITVKWGDNKHKGTCLHTFTIFY